MNTVTTFLLNRELSISSGLLNTTRPSLSEIHPTLLPAGRMRQSSRVTVVEGERIEGEVELGRDHWVFGQHFPRDPIFPGTLMIEAAGPLVALRAWGHRQQSRPRLVRTGAEFHRPVTPSDSLFELKARVQCRRHRHFATVRNSIDGAEAPTITSVLPPL